ncbi:MAG TPA: hypothetical protein VML55_20195, partial [Planctomycetaceae bacterium]|nr:hypothetical protein [Planctomycetaceae bacterium]
MDAAKRLLDRTDDPAHPGPEFLTQPTAAEPARSERPRRPLPSPGELLAAARKARKQHPGPMKLDEFERLTGFKSFHVTHQFAGGWTELRQRAGIPLHPRELSRWSDDELLAEFHRIAVELSCLPRWADIDRLARISAAPFHNRFRRKAELARRYRAWLETHDPASPLLAQLDAGGRRAGAPHRHTRRGPRRTEPPWPHRRLDTAPVYGEELN